MDTLESRIEYPSRKRLVNELTVPPYIYIANAAFIECRLPRINGDVSLAKYEEEELQKITLFNRLFGEGYTKNIQGLPVRRREIWNVKYRLAPGGAARGAIRSTIVDNGRPSEEYINDLKGCAAERGINLPRELIEETFRPVIQKLISLYEELMK